MAAKQAEQTGHMALERTLCYVVPVDQVGETNFTAGFTA